MSEVQSEQLSGLGVLRKRRAFAWIWAGQMVSRVGDSLDLIAFMWIVLELTGSTLMMGTLVVVNIVPSILLGPFAGVLVDRWSRKRVMIAADTARGLVTLVLAAMPLSAGLAGTVAEWLPIAWVFGSLGVLVLIVALAILWSGPFRTLGRGRSEGAGVPAS